MTPEQSVTQALVIAGNKGRYQYIVVGLLCFTFLMESYLLLGQSFYMMDPVFDCKGEPQPIDEQKACQKLDQCKISNDFTIVARMQLYCGRQGERDAIQSLLSIGSLVGLLLMNYLADLKGRKRALIIDLLVGFVGTLSIIVGAYVKSTTLLIIGSILSGFCGYAVVIISYIILSDICEQTLRQKGSVFLNLFFSLGAFTFFFMYKWCNEWYNILVLFLLLPLTGLIVVCMLLVQQSPNYFLCKRNDKEGCIKSLTNIALMNGKSKQDIQEMRRVIEKAQQPITESGDNKKMWQTLKQWKYLKIIIFMGIVESGANVFFYGIEYAVDDIGFDYGTDNLVMGITEMAMVVIATPFITKLKRKRTMFIVYPLTVLVSFSFILVGHNKYISTFLILCIRALTSIGYFMVMMVQTESFPLEIQSIGAGSIQALAQLGSFASPLIIDFAIHMGFNKLATMGVVLLLCLIPLKFVPEPSSHLAVEQDEHKESLLEAGGVDD